MLLDPAAVLAHRPAVDPVADRSRNSNRSPVAVAAAAAGMVADVVDETKAR